MIKFPFTETVLIELYGQDFPRSQQLNHNISRCKFARNKLKFVKLSFGMNFPHLLAFLSCSKLEFCDSFKMLPVADPDLELREGGGGWWKRVGLWMRKIIVWSRAISFPFLMWWNVRSMCVPQAPGYPVAFGGHVFGGCHSVFSLVSLWLFSCFSNN